MDTTEEYLMIPTGRLSPSDIETIANIVKTNSYELSQQIKNSHTIGILVPSGLIIDNHFELIRAYQKFNVRISGMGEIHLNIAMGVYK